MYPKHITHYSLTYTTVNMERKTTCALCRGGNRILSESVDYARKSVDHDGKSVDYVRKSWDYVTI